MMCQKIILNPHALKFHSNLPNLFAKNYQPQLLCSNKNFKHYSAADGGNTFMRSDFTHEHVMEHRGQPGKVNFHHFFLNLIQLIKIFSIKVHSHVGETDVPVEIFAHDRIFLWLWIDDTNPNLFIPLSVYSRSLKCIRIGIQIEITIFFRNVIFLIFD